MGVKIILTNGNEHFIPDVAEVTDKVVEELAKLNLENMVAGSLVDNRTVSSSIVENDCFSTGSSNAFETTVTGIVNEQVLDSSNTSLQDAVCLIVNEFCFSTADGTSNFGGAVESVVNSCFEPALISALTNNRASNKENVYIPAVYVLTALPVTGTYYTGDYCIVKDAEAGTQTAYMYVEDHWEALNGNYSANNVYFDEDILITTDIGYATVDSTTKRGYINAAGKSLTNVLGDLFAQEVIPENKDLVKSSIRVSINKSSNYEVGDTVTGLTYTLTFNPGTYPYGPNITDMSATWQLAINDNGSNGTLVDCDKTTDDLEDLVITDTTNFSVTGKATWDASGIYADTLKGNPTEVFMPSGTDTKTSGKIVGYRNYWYGFVPEFSTTANQNTITRSADNNKVSITTSNITTELTAGGSAAPANYLPGCSKKDNKGIASSEDSYAFVILVPSAANLQIAEVNVLGDVPTDVFKGDSSLGFLEEQCQIRGLGSSTEAKYDLLYYKPAALNPGKYAFKLEQKSN